MKTLTPKQEARLEKKKKRMAALVEVIKLNDRDGRKKAENTDDANNSNESLSDNSLGSPPETPQLKRKRPKIDDKIKHEEGSIDEKSDAIISDVDYTEMKKTVRERTKSSRYKPEIRLTLFGDSASLSVKDMDRTPIFLTDVQHLVMTALLGSDSPCSPSRWCVLEKKNQITHTVVLVLEGLSLYHYSSNETLFKETSKIFEHKLEVIMPPYHDGQIVNEIAKVPLTDSNRSNLIEKYGSLEVALESTEDPTLLTKTVFRVDESTEQGNAQHDNKEIIPRTQLLLSALQMVDEGYPLPLRGELSNRYRNFVFTKDSYKKISATSPMFGLDCEMCRTSAGINELTRISIVDEQYKCVYETLVRPENIIVDYLTRYSGITSEIMMNVTKTLSEVQNDVRNLLPADAILVGHSLQMDLMVMKMIHPYVIDTSVIFNLSGQRKVKSKLQTLMYEFLGEKIQLNALGHDSIEDSASSLKLAKLKLSKGMYFGDEILSGRKRANENNKNSTSPSSKEKDTSTAFIISAETDIDMGKFQTSNSKITVHQAETNKIAIKKTNELAISNALTISHIKIQSHRLASDKCEKTISKIDRWIDSIWKGIAAKGLFIVLIGGVPSTSSGVVLMKIKKPI